MLQGKNVDLLKATQEARVVINIMKTERGGGNRMIAAEFDIEPCMPRTTGRERDAYLLLIDHLIQEMNDRLLSQEDRFLGQYLLSTKLHGLTNNVQDKMYAANTI